MPEDAIVLLDTHVWVWLSFADERLSPARAASIRDAAHRSRLRLSAISVWEVAMLESKGRLQLDPDCMQWVHESLAKSGVEIAPLTPEISVDSVRLPGSFHSEPSDRIIIATARRLNAILVTADAAILQYAQQGHLHALPA